VNFRATGGVLETGEIGRYGTPMWNSSIFFQIFTTDLLFLDESGPSSICLTVFNRIRPMSRKTNSSGFYATLRRRANTRPLLRGSHVPQSHQLAPVAGGVLETGEIGRYGTPMWNSSIFFQIFTPDLFFLFLDKSGPSSIRLAVFAPNSSDIQKDQFIRFLRRRALQSAPRICRAPSFRFGPKFSRWFRNTSSRIARLPIATPS
jgi:hypothetical protein